MPLRRRYAAGGIATITIWNVRPWGRKKCDQIPLFFEISDGLGAIPAPGQDSLY